MTYRLEVSEKEKELLLELLTNERQELLTRHSDQSVHDQVHERMKLVDAIIARLEDQGVH